MHWSRFYQADSLRGMTTQNEDAARLGANLGRTRGATLVRRLAGALLALALFGPAMSAGVSAAADVKPSAAEVSAAAHLSDEESERQAEAISRSIMSPFCTGRTVSSCPNAQPWRDDIRKWVKEGVSADEIKRRLAERIPQHDLMGIPKNRLGWVLPVGLGLGALGTLIFLLRYLVKPRGTDLKLEGTEGASSAAAGGGKPVADDYDARLDQELETLEQR
jgi:cytochrome c-type biogenesis protein CcmH/NrfF